MTNTETLWINASCQSPVIKPVAMSVINAMTNTIGTKIPEIRSAIFWIGALLP